MTQRVLVTGAGAGIGLAIARAFAESGARVHICDIDPARMADSGVSDAFGTTVADVADPADVVRLFDEASAHLGGLDVLVNNAGSSGPTGPVESLDYADWRRTIEGNLDSQFLCTKQAVPMLRVAGGGSIVNISSSAGLHGYPMRTPYAAAKWGVIGLTKTLAMELGPEGIRVNAIAPGEIKTSILSPGTEEQLLPDIPMGRLGTPEEVARTIYFLCTDNSSYVNGAEIHINGGQHV